MKEQTCSVNEMNYEDVQNFLKEAEHYGCRPGLASIRALMHRLGDPQERLRIIHIAGTNGKGSTGAMIAASLTQAGYKTGHFSSPAVFSFEEMYTIDGEQIGQAACAAVISDVAAACAQMEADGAGHPTRFEIETAAAFLWFWQQGCDAAVIEAGMGGTLDATNLITRPVLSVITPVSMDHTQFLGNTIEEIAANKAGIIKPGCPVVTAVQEAQVLQVLRQRADALDCPFYESGGHKDLPDQLAHPGCGAYQRTNAACAVTALRVLRKEFPRISRRCTQEAFAGLRLHGRMERIAKSPDFYIDGAHNTGAAKVLRETLDTCFTERRIIYIMGVLADKNVDGILDLMFADAGPAGEKRQEAGLAASKQSAYAEPVDGKCARPVVLTVTPPSIRALDGSELADKLHARGIAAAAFASCGEAVQAAYDRAGQAGSQAMILAFGSFTILADVRRAVQEHAATDSAERS